MTITFRSSFKYLAWLVLIAACLMAAKWYWHTATLYPSTDNAYIQANVIQVAPQVSGKVSQVLVEENQVVHKGDVLFKIDARMFQLQAEKAMANLADTRQRVAALELAIKVANANVEKANAQFAISQKSAKRILSLVHDGRASKQQGDDVLSKLKIAKAELQAASNELLRNQQLLGDSVDENPQIIAAEKQLDEAELNLQYTTITAPADGTITQLHLRQGDMVNANVAQFSLVENNQFWIAANFKETALGRIKSQQNVNIEIDMYPGKTFQGRVESVSPGSGAAFALLPPENASGNWVKITQRFPVKISLQAQSPYALRLGASCKVTVNTA